MSSADGPSERIFLGWERPILQSAADRLVAAADPQGPLDLSGILVALPGGRAGRRLEELLLERAEAGERPLRPPRITTVGRLPEELYLPDRPVPGPVLDRLAWRDALRSLEPDERATLMPTGSDPDGRALSADPELALRSLEDTVRALHREVGAVGRDFSEVSAVCRRVGTFNDEERWRALASAQHRHREILARAGFRDRESARRRALGIGDPGSPLEIWLVGATDFPGIVADFLAAADPVTRIRVLVGAPPSLSERFDRWGRVLPAAWRGAHVGLPEDRIRVVANPRAQADSVVGRLASLGGAVSAEEITIGVPDAEVVPYLRERLEECGVRCRDAAGRPLDRTAIFRLIETLARFLETESWESLAGLVRFPALEHALRARRPQLPGDLPGILDAYRSRHLQARVRQRGRIPGERDASVVRSVRVGIGELVGDVEEPRPLAAWANRIGALLTALLEHDEALDDGGRGARLGSVIERLGGALDALRSLPREVDGPVSVVTALRTLLDALRDESVPPVADEDAVELLGWLELALDDAPVMLVTGFNEPHVPESTTAHPFLPHSLRTALGLLDNDGRWARDLVSLKTIVETRGDLLLIAGRRNAAGDPLRISRLLLAERPEVVARRVLSFLGETDDEAAGVAEAPRPEARVEARSEFALPPEPILSDPSPLDRISVTAFRWLLVDPYRFALERILRLERSDDRARELDPLGFGILAHEVLERFGRARMAEGDVPPGDGDAIRRVLDSELADSFDAWFGAEALPAIRIQMEQLRARLHAFADVQARWEAQGWRIRAVEASVPEGVDFEVDGRPILLSGTIDRIDENVLTREWCILDYKTGARPDPPDATHRRGRGSDREWIDLQLPLYRRLASGVRGPGEGPQGEPLVPQAALDSAHLGYVTLSRDPADVSVRLADWGPDELAGAEERAREAIRVLRANRFEYRREESSIGADDDLAVVVGRNTLAGEADIDSERDDE